MKKNSHYCLLLCPCSGVLDSKSNYGVRRNGPSHLIHIFWEYSEHTEQYESSTTQNTAPTFPGNGGGKGTGYLFSYNWPTVNREPAINAM